MVFVFALALGLGGEDCDSHGLHQNCNISFIPLWPFNIRILFFIYHPKYTHTQTIDTGISILGKSCLDNFSLQNLQKVKIRKDLYVIIMSSQKPASFKAFGLTKVPQFCYDTLAMLIQFQKPK